MTQEAWKAFDEFFAILNVQEQVDLLNGRLKTNSVGTWKPDDSGWDVITKYIPEGYCLETTETYLPSENRITYEYRVVSSDSLM